MRVGFAGKSELRAGEGCGSSLRERDRERIVCLRGVGWGRLACECGEGWKMAVP